MRDNHSVHRIGRGKKWLIWLCVIVALLLSLGLVLFVVDRVAKARITERYGPTLSADVQFRILDGTTLAYRQLGTQGPAILLIHGFMGSSYDYAAIWPALSETHQVIAVDLIGFGLSDKSTDLAYSKRNMARLCGLLMADLGYEQYAVLGHSMGGEVALHLAVIHPEQVQKLILLNSAGLEDIHQGFRPALPAWLIEGLFKNYLLQRLVFPISMHNRSVATTDTFNRFYYFNSQIPARTLQKLTQDNDSGSLADRIGGIEQPALLIWGEQDRIIPVAQGRQLDALLPHSHLVVLAACGHLTFLEKPAETLAAIVPFLEQVLP